MGNDNPDGVGGIAVCVTDPRTHETARLSSLREFQSLVATGGLDASFAQTPAVLEFTRLLVSRRGFFVGALRRELSRVLLAKCATEEIDGGTELRPDGNDVKALCAAHPEVFGAGAATLPPGSHRLRPRKMLWWHSQFCDRCHWDRQIFECKAHLSCYFSDMLRCVERGWQPPFYTSCWTPPYHVTGNYTTTALYREGVEGELVGSMVPNGAIVACSPSPTQVVHPVGAVVKSSDKMRAKALLGVTVKDQESLALANEGLAELGLPKIKVRVTMDCTATGANAAVKAVRFAYPGLRNGVDMVVRDSVLGVCDVSRYFHSFPWAYAMRDKMRIQWEGRLYECWGLSFGFALCPYYCSAWSAEFRIWVLNLIGECAHMVDDWLLQGVDLEEVQARCQKLADMFESIGLGMATEKNKYGTSVKFLGVIIDTVAMRLRIDGLQALGTRLLLQEVRIKLAKDQKVGKGTWYHLAGKLNWFAEVVQSGRLHTHSFWDFLREVDESRAPRSVRDRVLRDIDWWVRLLSSWEGDNSSGGEYRILSAAEISARPDLLYVIQSDAAGEDGVGYVHGYHHDGAERIYGSIGWGEGGPPGSSHAMELRALRCCLESSTLPKHPLVLLWVTDSTSAALSINKGNCRSIEGYTELEAIFGICDAHGFELLAMWAPREDNVLADYLSHLSAVLGRGQVHGKVGTLAAKTGGSAGGGRPDFLGEEGGVY